MPTIESVEVLLQPLVFGALIIGAASYLLLIRRRRHERDNARDQQASQDRAMARWRELEHPDGDAE